MTFVKRQVKRRVLYVELGVTVADFARLNSKHLSVKLKASLNILYIERQMRLERLYHLRLSLHFQPPQAILSHIRPSEYEIRYSRQTYLSRHICSGYAK